jgi:hypothetical protein
MAEHRDSSMGIPTPTKSYGVDAREPNAQPPQNGGKAKQKDTTPGSAASIPMIHSPGSIIQSKKLSNPTKEDPDLWKDNSSWLEEHFSSFNGFDTLPIDWHASSRLYSLCQYTRDQYNRQDRFD